MKWTYAAAALALSVAVGAASCSNAESTTSPSGSSGGGSGNGLGTLQVLMKDSPFSDADAVLVTFTEVSAHHTGAGWQRLPFAEAAEARTCDLKRLEEVTDLLGVGQLEAGHYTQLRLEVSRTRIYWDNKSTGAACASTIISPLGTFSEATVPSGTLHLNRQFTIEPGATTTITLDFDGDKSIKQTGNGKYMMQPVIAIMSVTGGTGQ
jgi:Domain of unknown function (DUF4382)